MRRWIWILGPLSASMVWLAPLSLEPKAHRLAGWALWIVLWWITECIPLAVTAVMGSAGMVLLGICSANAAFAPFAHPLILLFWGGFVLARGLCVHGLDNWLALRLISLPMVRGIPSRVLVALLLAGVCLSMWISNTATAAMMLAIALGVSARLFPESETNRDNTLIAVAYSASLGGLATPVGSPPNLITMGMLDRFAGISLTFFDWMLVGLPVSILGLGLLCLTLFRRLHLQHREYRPLETVPPPSLRTEQLLVSIPLGMAIFFWLLPGGLALVLGRENPTAQWLDAHLPESVVAVLAACLLFILRHQDRPLLTWSDAVKIDWSALLLFGGGISLGTQAFETGLADMLGGAIPALAGGDPSLWTYTLVCVLLGTFLTELVSNTACANLLLPIVIAGAQQQGISPLIPAVGCGLGCSLAFMLPISTPPNAVLYGSGEVTLKQMMRFGLWMNLLGTVAIMSVLFAWSLVRGIH